MTQFSVDHGAPPARFKPGPGQIGQAAAMKAHRGGGKPPGGGKVSGKGGGGSGSDHSLGLPGAPAPGPEASPPADNRHLMILAQHQNMKQLGRDIPFGIWATNTGLFRQLGMQPGQQPFDLFDDTF